MNSNPNVDMGSTVVCFYHEYEDNGCFSNWYHAEFDYAGKHFSCVEQFMMYHKVMMFHQHDLGERILSSTDPSEMKRLGRTRFPEFDDYLWDHTCYTIVKRGVRAKFEQNPDILKILLDTEDRLIAECSRCDSKWGIGLDISDLYCHDVSQWGGKNYLGRILMEVRDELRRASALGRLGYVDVMDKSFPQWEKIAGELRRNPKYYHTLHAYADTIKSKSAQVCFFFDGPLSGWDEAMHTNMGGGLPIIGFYEMKQDLYDIARLS